MYIVIRLQKAYHIKRDWLNVKYLRDILFIYKILIMQLAI